MCAGVSTRAAQSLRQRSRYVSVADSLSKADSQPATTIEYLTRVAELAAHRTYHFPAAGLQLTSYLAWLMRTFGNRPIAETRAADAQAREVMAARPGVLYTALDWDLLCKPGAEPARPSAVRTRPPSKTVCQNFLSGRCPYTPYPWQRPHSACRICRLGDHPTHLHSETTYGVGAKPVGSVSRVRTQANPYPPRGRGVRR